MSSLRYLEETIHFSAVGAFATMAFEEWNDVPIQIDVICKKKKYLKKILGTVILV